MLRLLPRLHPRPFLRLHPRLSRQTSTIPRPSAPPNQPPGPPPPASLSSRFKSLSREYGYSALGVYLFLSALDFPFCFLAVRYFGTERVGAVEERVVNFAKPYWAELKRRVGIPEERKPEDSVLGRPAAAEATVSQDDERGASIWTELALAYAVHKSFIFIRVPLTAAVTPRVVRVLRGWGWDIGKPGKPKIGPIPRRKE